MREIGVEELEVRPVDLFKNTWGALTSGNDETGFNAMTIAWGSIGTLWERGSRKKMLPVCNVYVRPSRFTNHLIAESGLFSVSFMPSDNKVARRGMAYLGAKSGADDPHKIQTAGFGLVRDDGWGYLEGADLVLLCKVVYAEQLDEPHLLEKDLMEYNYHGQYDNMHNMYVGEILKVLVAG